MAPTTAPNDQPAIEADPEVRIPALARFPWLLTWLVHQARRRVRFYLR